MTVIIGTEQGDPGRSPLIPFLGMAASTGPGGFTLVNGTPAISSWTAPADGNLHTVSIPAVLHVTTLEVGGQVAVSWTAPDGTTFTSNLASAAQAAGLYTTLFNALVAPGTTVTVKQNTALTGGAAVFWAVIWAA